MTVNGSNIANSWTSNGVDVGGKNSGGDFFIRYKGVPEIFCIELGMALASAYDEMDINGAIYYPATSASTFVTTNCTDPTNNTIELTTN